MQKPPDTGQLRPQSSTLPTDIRGTKHSTSPDAVPLCVDLDGTLLRIDTLHELILSFVKQQPWSAWRMFLWLVKGRAYFKRQIAQAVSLDFSTLPVTRDFHDFLKREHARGRKLVLATGADSIVAKQAAEHFGIFDGVISSDGIVNSTGKKKRERIVQQFGESGFDYAGNSTADLPIWRTSREPIFVNASPFLVRRAAKKTSDVPVFGSRASWFSTWARALRIHQWAKNLLILMPAIAGHELHNVPLLWNCAIAIAAFCLCASSVYITNDLGDLESDRLHRSKNTRPFAAGELSAAQGVRVAGLLLVLAFACALFLPPMFAAYLGIYYVTALLYSFVIRKTMLLDVFALAAMYTLRILGGHGATGIRYSSWMLGFSMFLFLSLALLKRYTELHRVNLAGRKSVVGRDYATTDLPVLLAIGPLSGWLSALVLSLYISSEDVRVVYEHPLRLLFICPLLLYWISRIWLLAARDALHDDPVVFALKDRPSYVIGALAALFIWFGSI